MKIPNSTLSWTQISRYGGGVMELEPGVAEPGCPRLYKAMYVDERLPELESMELGYGRAIHEALYVMEDEAVGPDEALRRVWPIGLGPERMQEALDDLEDVVSREGILTQLHTVALETNLRATLYIDEDFGEVEYQGIIDVLSVDSEMASAIPTLYFSDYKTNRAPPSKEQAMQWRQGLGYAWLTRANAPRFVPDADRVHVVGFLDSVKWYALRVDYTDDMIDLWREWAITVARTILRDTEAHAKLNPGCSYCPIRGDCPAWAQLPAVGSTLLERLGGAPLAKRVEWMGKATEIKNRLDSEIKSIRQALSEKIMAEGPFETSTSTWLLEQSRQWEVDPAKLHRLMGDEFYPAISVRKGDVEKWLRKHPERQADVDRISGYVPGNMRLKEEGNE